MTRMLLIFAMLFAPAASAQDHRDAFRSVTPTNFDMGGEVTRQFHLNAESYFSMAAINRRTPPHEFVVELDASLADLTVAFNDKEARFEDYVAGDPLLDGVIVLHDDKIVFEAYPNMDPWDRHFAWSVTKVVISTTLAALAENGLVDMTAPAGRYAPELAGSVWETITIQNIADMASGVDCLDSDGYQDTTTCVYRLEESLGITATAGARPGFIGQLQSMAPARAAGEAYEYVSANTNVLGLVIENVTGEPLAAVLQEIIWDRIGAEADGLIAVSEEGYAYAAGGLHARLRDIARFGRIFVRPDEVGVLSNAAVKSIQAGGVELPDRLDSELKEEFGDDVPVRAGWQWDRIWTDGALYKSGYSGQGIYVDPARRLVIVWFGTGLGYDETKNSMLSISRQIARSEALKGR